MKGVVAPFINLTRKWNLLSTHMWEGKLFKLRGQLSLDKTAAKAHLYYRNHLSVSTDNSSMDCAWCYSAQGACGALAGHNNEVNPTHSTSRSHALFGVTLPCPGKCWACKTELSIIQHEQEDVWSDMGGGQGPTKPRADRGYHFDVSVWACRVEQGALGNLLELPHPTSNPTTPSFFFPLPPNAEPLCTLYVLLRFPLWHALSLSLSLHLRFTHT